MAGQSFGFTGQEGWHVINSSPEREPAVAGNTIGGHIGLRRVMLMANNVRPGRRDSWPNAFDEAILAISSRETRAWHRPLQ